MVNPNDVLAEREIVSTPYLISMLHCTQHLDLEADIN